MARIVIRPERCAAIPPPPNDRAGVCLRAKGHDGPPFLAGGLGHERA